MFITKYGGVWVKETADNPVSKEFAKLSKVAGIKRKGATFYALRHTVRMALSNYPYVQRVQEGRNRFYPTF